MQPRLDSVPRGSELRTRSFGEKELFFGTLPVALYPTKAKQVAHLIGSSGVMEGRKRMRKKSRMEMGTKSAARRQTETIARKKTSTW